MSEEEFGTLVNALPMWRMLMDRLFAVAPSEHNFKRILGVYIEFLRFYELYHLLLA